MKKTSLIMVLLHIVVLMQAQLPNAKTATVSIAGNCGICKETIEKSGSAKGDATVTWDADTQRASITYDSAATTLDAVLKQVAYAGYDNERYLAPAEAYASLDACCQYERGPQATVVAETKPTKEPVTHNESHAKPIDAVLDAYFALKDALVVGKADEVPALATALSKQLNGLSTPEAKQATAFAGSVAKAKSIEDQRAKFVSLSESIYALSKANAPSTVVYYQHCPMYNKGKGANWLSPEKAIRNPYYGDQMLTCGKVVETLGK